MFRFAANAMFVSLSKLMRVKTMVGTPRCGVRSAQRADPTNRAPSHTKNHAQRVGKSQHDTAV